MSFLGRAGDILKAIFDVLNGVFGSGQSLPFIDYATSGTSTVPLYRGQKIVKQGFLQNLSNTDTLTVFASYGTAGAGAGVAGQGSVLNPASSSGQGGGTFIFGNVDLSNFYIVFSTNSGQKYSVYGET